MSSSPALRQGRLAAASGLVLLAAGAVSWGQEPAASPPEWVPRWQVGTWWTVRTYQRDTKARMFTPTPAEGGQPDVPGLDGEALPGLPPMRDGVPVGYKQGNSFRFDVVRREAVRYEDDEPGTPPEEFWVVQVKSEEGEPVRSGELWFAVADLNLAKVVVGAGPQARVFDLSGRGQFDPPVTQELGFPLDWPDLSQAAVEQADVEVPGRAKLEQSVHLEERKDPKAPLKAQLTLRLSSRSTRTRVDFVFSAGVPFWERLVSDEWVARITGHGGPGR